MQTIQIYTDGGCRNTGNNSGDTVNPNDKAAWATLLIFGKYTKELTGSEFGKTNNYMEITAVIKGLSALKRFDLPVIVYSDSAYVINTLNEKWYQNWQKNNWHTSKKQLVKNKELWQQLITLINKFKNIKFIKVKGHANNKYNNYVDALLNKTMDQM